MPNVTWLQCCQEAIAKVNAIEGVLDATNNNKKNSDKLTIQNRHTITNWWRRYRLQGGCFLNPRVRRGVPRLAPILDRNPEFKRGLCEFATHNLAELSAESMSNYLHDKALPELLRQRQEEPGNADMTRQELLAENGLTKICVSTIYNWLQALGFSYSPRKKSYYVDTHETKENVAYRNNFIKRYLNYELRTYRWIQLQEEEVIQLEDKGEIQRAIGHKYTSEGQTFVEFHVDDHPSFLDRMLSGTPFGGNLSVRMTPGNSPAVLFGQDECIFKQYAFTNKSWVAPDGGRALIPKDEGMGVMISAFQSREFGYGMSLTDTELELINDKRRGTKYHDEQAAIATKGTAEKKPIKSSPFVVEFEYYGTNAEGYWNYDAMVTQFEDCVDCVKTLHPNLAFVFLFDHSCVMIANVQT